MFHSNSSTFIRISSLSLIESPTTTLSLRIQFLTSKSSSNTSNPFCTIRTSYVAFSSIVIYVVVASSSSSYTITMTESWDYYIIISVTLMSIILLLSTFIRILVSPSSYWGDENGSQGCPAGFASSRRRRNRNMKIR